MTAAVTRTLKITYAGLVVGGTSDYLIHGRVSMTKAYARALVAFNVIVQDDTLATFLTKCAALEAAYETPRAALLVEMEGSTFLAYDPAANTGFHSEPTIAKSASGADTGRSRLYACSVAFDLPADLSGVSGRAYATTNLDYDAARRMRIVITGRYTALGASGAKAQYTSAGATYCASVVSTIGSGGTFDLVDEQVIPEDQDKWCDFSRTYQEIFYGPVSATLAHASIRAAAITYQRTNVAPGDSPGKNAKRLVTIMASIQCAVDHAVSTDLEGLWDDHVKPWVLAQMKSRFDVSTVADVGRDGGFVPTANGFGASLTCLCVVSGSSTIEYRQSVKISTETGELLQPAWGGDRYNKYRFEGIADRTRETLEIETRVGTFTVDASGESFSGGAGGGGIGASASGRGSGGSPGGGVGTTAASTAKPPTASAGGASATGGDGWVVAHRELSATPITLGDDSQFTVTQMMTLTVERYYKEPTGGGSSGPATSPGTGPGPNKGPIGAITPAAR